MEVTGKELVLMTQNMFNSETITQEQLAYTMDMLRPSSYLLRNHSIRNRPITFYVSDRDMEKAFSHRPWQVQIINDMHRNIAIIKSRQLGLSEMGVGKLLHFSDVYSYDSVKSLYTFPTGEQMKRFVQTRLDPVLQKGYYSTIVDDKVDSLSAKRIRDSFIYFRSSSRPGALEGIDIDYLSMDEYDRVPTLAEASALESMSSSKYKIINRWSTPSIPNMGIHKLFEESDQFWYLHKCDHCNYHNQLSYDDYDSSSVDAGGNILTVNADGVDPLAKTVVDGSFQFVCKKCGKPLDRWYNGQWVAKYPERTQGGQGTRGYMISQLNAVWITADALKRKELTSLSKQAFYNYTLGYPYEDLKLAVTDSDVFDHTSQALNPSPDRGDYKFISVGIDWGNRHWVSIHGIKESGQVDLIRLFSVGKSLALDATSIGADLEAIKVALSPYKPDIIVADVGDSGDKVAKLIKYYGEHKVFGCQYNSSPRSTGQLIPVWSENTNLVKVDKLMQNKRYISMLKEGEIHHYKNRDNKDIQQYVIHWKNVVVRDEEDEKTGEFYQTITRKGDDHYAQAAVYSMLGWERLKDLHYGSGSYAFNADFIGLQYGPTQTDIYSKF